VIEINKTCREGGAGSNKQGAVIKKRIGL